MKNGVLRFLAFSLGVMLAVETVFAAAGDAETYTQGANILDGKTPPTAYVAQDAASAAQKNLEVAYAFDAWSAADMPIYEKVMAGETLTEAETNRFQEVYAQLKPYFGCHADFVVSFDRAVKAGTVSLSGNYGTWGWLTFDVPRDIAAGEQFRLLDSYNIRYSYYMILNQVAHFLCGCSNNHPANYGTTMTVELRLYLPKDYNVDADHTADITNDEPEAGPYMVIGTYSHTFQAPGVKEVRLTTAGDVAVKGADGTAIAAPTEQQALKLAHVKAQINANTTSGDKTGTGVIPAGQDKTDSAKPAAAAVEALKDAHPAYASQLSADSGSYAYYLKIKLDAVKIDTDAQNAVKALAYDVKPMVVTTVLAAGGETETIEAQIPNSEITAPIEFLLPVTSEFIKGARVEHDGDPERLAVVETTAGDRYVVASANHFSLFTLYPENVVQASVASANIMAVKRVPGTGKGEVVAAVPWRALETTQNVTVDKLIATGRAAGDEISAWNTTTRAYDIWRFNGTTWEAATDAKSGRTAPSATTTTLPRGTAVWYKRGGDASAAYSQIGGYVVETVETPTVAGGTTSANKPMNNLLINPFYEDVDLTKIPGASGDQIQVISTMKVYTNKDGQWGTLQLVTVSSPFGEVKQQQFVAASAITVPAGQGFWYISKGGAPAIDWKAIAAGE